MMFDHLFDHHYDAVEVVGGWRSRGNFEFRNNYTNVCQRILKCKQIFCVCTVGCILKAVTHKNTEGQYVYNILP